MANFLNLMAKQKSGTGRIGGKEYEFFTSLGYHPETGDPLKPITQYMIRKYIRNDWKQNNNN